ncbi:MAG TPA: hypothetical protein VE175_00360 [Woeseiaceae bacterium]|nr:hypothetical protein [Woeseiaceae bacterium]
MVKKATKKPRRRKPRKLAKTDRFPLIEKALRKRTKEDLIKMIVMIAKDHSIVVRELEARLELEKPVDLLVADVSSAIDRAVDFDERLTNWNLDVDWQAYADVRKGLSLLVKLGYLDDAMSLALKLMKDGSYQVECSDEGLMTDEIEACLKPVIRAVKAAGGDRATQWASGMQAADRVGFICDGELSKLREAKCL